MEGIGTAKKTRGASQGVGKRGKKDRGRVGGNMVSREEAGRDWVKI